MRMQLVGLGLVTVLIALAPATAWAEDTSGSLTIAEKLHLRYVEGQAVSIVDEDLLRDGDASLRALLGYVRSADENTRRSSLVALAHLGVIAGSKTIRQAAVSALTEALRSTTKEEVGVRIAWLDSLQRFSVDDFSEDDRRTVFEFACEMPCERSVRLVAIAGVSDAVEWLSTFSNQHDAKRLRWSALLARARLGDEGALALVVKEARSLVELDPMGRFSVLSKDLCFVRSPAAIDVVVDIVFHVDRRGLRVTGHAQPSAAGVILAMLIDFYPGMPVPEVGRERALYHDPVVVDRALDWLWSNRRR